MRSDNHSNCKKEDLLLYAVTDRSWLNGETLYAQVEKALKGGVTFVQLREKNLDEVSFLEEAKVGAVFPTDSKADAVEVSHETVKAICEAVDIPVIAIGGITAENVAELAGTGICGIAVISAVFAQKDIKEAAQHLKSHTEEMLKAQQ